MSALRKQEVCACPYCGQAMEGDDAALDTLQMPRKMRATLDAIRSAGGRWVAMERIEFAVWGSEIDGGPADASAGVHYHVHHLRTLVRPLGFRIENSRNLGYRLVRSEAAR